MKYEEAEQYIQEAGRSGMALGLSRMKELLRGLGNPHEPLKLIHVAGTNGKGSTVAYISSVLSGSGYRVGRYTSPPVFEYEECIQYEDREGIHSIGRDMFAEAVTRCASVIEQMKRAGEEIPTRFEIETAVAFLAFLQWRCDVVVLEVGLGGREDATNVIDRVLASVITPVSLDHRSVLGSRIEEIAAEKAGIIKEESHVITAQDEREALSVIGREAENQKASLHVVRGEDMSILSADIEGICFLYKGKQYRTRMAGLYQAVNACLAIETCRWLPEPFCLTDQQIQDGIRRAVWHGRFEVISHSPLVILDGAHNPSGAASLRKTIETLLKGRTLHAVMGVFKDKDYEKIVKMTAPLFHDVITITPSGERGLDAESLARVWRRCGCREAGTAVSVTEAIREMSCRCRAEDGIVVFGSLSFMGELCFFP